MYSGIPDRNVAWNHRWSKFNLCSLRIQNTVIGDTLEKSALISTMEDLRRPGLALACLLLSESGAGLSADLMKAEEEKMSLALAVAKVDLPSCSSLSDRGRGAQIKASKCNSSQCAMHLINGGGRASLSV